MATVSTPYYIIPLIEEYKQAEGERRIKLAARIALAIGNPVTLKTVLGINPVEFSNFYSDMALPQLSTVDTIDTFIDKFGDPGVKEKSELEDILPPVSTYSIDDLSELPEIEGVDSSDIPMFDAKALSSADLTSIADSINSSQDEKINKPTVHDLEEKLRDLIKNRDYQDAIDTIMEINLNNPKKSVYFADQIRFLKKLIELSN